MHTYIYMTLFALNMISVKGKMKAVMGVVWKNQIDSEALVKIELGTIFKEMQFWKDFIKPRA